MNGVLAGLRALGPARLVALAGVGLAMLALLAVLTLKGGGGGGGAMGLLYGDLDPREAGQITEKLDRARITHRESGSGDRIEVPLADIPRARLLLARDGLPSGGSVGYEIFDRGDGLTATDFQQQINETRALEGELARSIRMIAGVRAARVHVVLPRRQLFAQGSDPAQASVMLTMAGGAVLGPGEVQAVLNLVAAAVPGLKPQAIAVVDNRGRLLARAGGEEGGLQAATADELRHAQEIRLARGVEEMLERALGPGHVRAEAAVSMRFDHTAETTESYNPDQQVVRSTQTSTSSSRSSEGEKPVTVQNNLPNADAAQSSQSGSQEQKQEETTNYEIGKVVRSVASDQPQIARISMAVMVDGVMAPGPGGKTAWQERSADDLARIRRIVESAIGFDAKRGDTVEVVSMPFVAAAEPPPEAVPFWQSLSRAEILALGQSGLLAAAVLGAMLFVLRPMMLQLTSLPDGAALAAAGAALPGGGLLALGTAAAPPALPAPGQAAPAVPPAALTDETMVAIANVEGQMRASSIRTLSGLVEKHPEETLAIIRGWLAQERGG